MRKASWDVESNNSKGFAMERAAGVKEGGEISPLSQVNKGVKRKSEFQTVYCSVCKVFLNSSSQAAAHYSGKSHQNKVRSQSSLVSEIRSILLRVIQHTGRVH